MFTSRINIKEIIKVLKKFCFQNYAAIIYLSLTVNIFPTNKKGVIYNKVLSLRNIISKMTICIDISQKILFI